jgi:5-methylcytosine-specific restriction endonuclease McrA
MFALVVWVLDGRRTTCRGRELGKSGETQRMPWPFRLDRPGARKRAARETISIVGASSAPTLSDVISAEASRKESEISGSGATYACHYCGRANGLRTKDHKIPRIFGGAGLAGNIVRCCLMCNMIKSARPYGLFVVLFREFLEAHGAEYLSADPDDLATLERCTESSISGCTPSSTERARRLATHDLSRRTRRPSDCRGSTYA